VSATKVPFGEQAIVGRAKQLQIVGGVAAATSPRAPVMKLQESASIAADALFAHESATKAITR